MEVKFPQGSAADIRNGGHARPVDVGSIDLNHLSRQTMGDSALAREVLEMFDEQLAQARTTLAASSIEERFHIAHTLKGTAAGIGAFRLASCAGELEQKPSKQELVEQLSSLIDEVRLSIADILRSSSDQN
jgi:HPt (histidine-containing phosphotransfer) domain-containing protein